MKNRSRSFSVLASALCSALLAVSCEGSETDNPVSTLPDVFDGTSPENFTPPSDGAPPCDPNITAPSLPIGLAKTVWVMTAGGPVLATTGSYSSGLRFVDASDPEHPVVLSEGAVTGDIGQLLVASSGELWVVATEAPRVDDNALPSADALQPQLRLIRLDVSDPTRPVRIAEATLEGDLWALRERNGDVWVLTARLRAELRACDSPLNQPFGCVGRSYEALLLHGFHPDGAALQPIGQAELPFEERSWWGADGVVTALADGTVHVVSWDDAGALRSALTLQPGANDVVAGPADVVGNELSIVGIAEEQMSLEVYDLDSGATAPVRSFPLGPLSALGMRAQGTNGYSLFADRHLWLQVGQDVGEAQVWDLTGGTPVHAELPLAFSAIVPLEGTAGDQHNDEVLALGWVHDPLGSDGVHLVSIRGSVVSVVDEPGLDLSSISLYGNFGYGAPAPEGLQREGEASRVLHVRGSGLPIGVGALRGGAPVSDADVSEVAVVEARDPSRPQAWRLDVTHAGSTQTFNLTPETRALFSTGKSVVAVATSLVDQCRQSGADCTGYAPGVSVFDLSGEPREVATLPFPELPLPLPSDPNRLVVRWDIYDPLTGGESAGLELGERQLAFVAQLDLSCDSPETCDAFDIEPVPVSEANVAFGTPAPCPPVELDPDCVAAPAAAPSVYGTGQRQYFYVLDFDAPGGPAFESWGVSRLAATSRRTDRDSRFAAPFATDGVLATTRLERRRSATDVNDPGATHFFLDRFERSASGEIVAQPPVNLPGYAMARLGADDTRERWVSVEAAPDQTGEARLYRVNIRTDGARIERQLDLGGAFAGFRMLSFDSDARLGMVLLTPDDACGVTRLSTVRLGTTGGDADEPLEIAGTLELPSDDWVIVAIDRDLAVVRHDSVYVLVRVGADGTPSVVSSRAVDVPLGHEQLLGTNLFGAANYSGHRSIDFSSTR
jgi:hypothetical protein